MGREYKVLSRLWEVYKPAPRGMLFSDDISIVGAPFFARGVRAIVRDAAKAHTWTQQGCEIALANFEDADALSAAFQDVEGVFVMLPPVFDPRLGFPEAKSAIAALTQSLKRAAPPKIVCLSTIGADAEVPAKNRTAASTAILRIFKRGLEALVVKEYSRIVNGNRMADATHPSIVLR